MDIRQATQNILEILARDNANLILSWKDFHNEPVHATLRKVYSPRQYFGQYWSPERRDADDVPMALFDNTLLGSMDNPAQYLQDVAELIQRYNEHHRLILVHVLDRVKNSGFRVSDPWTPRDQDALRAVRQVRDREGALARWREDHVDWSDDGKPIVPGADFLRRWFGSRRS